MAFADAALKDSNKIERQLEEEKWKRDSFEW